MPLNQSMNLGLQNVPENRTGSQVIILENSVVKFEGLFKYRICNSRKEEEFSWAERLTERVTRPERRDCNFIYT